MTKVLHIDSSIFGENGNSPQLTASLVKQLKEVNADIDVTYRNLGESDIPHFSAATIADIGEGKAELADALIEELKEADIVVIGAPMYNFGIPTQLKAWFDHVARAGSTFKYTESGPVGLLENKKAFVVTTRGGVHKGLASDVETDHIKIFLSFVGITDTDMIFAEGLNLSGDHKESAMRQAESDITAAIKNYLA